MEDKYKKELLDTLYKQFVIYGIFEDRFRLLKSVFEEYKSNPLGANTNFFLSMMYTYRTCVIIDLCKLFIVPKEEGAKDRYKRSSQHINFFYTITAYKDILGESASEVHQILTSLLDKIQLIVDERNLELVHKDSSTGTEVKLDVKYMNEIETLVIKSREILDILFKSQECEIVLEKDHSKMRTLKKIIEFLNLEQDKSILLK